MANFTLSVGSQTATSCPMLFLLVVKTSGWAELIAFPSFRAWCCRNSQRQGYHPLSLSRMRHPMTGKYEKLTSPTQFSCKIF